MSGTTFFFSNDLESLLSQNINLLASPSLFAPSPLIIVQNKSMEQWLKLKIADAQGISIHQQFVSANEAIRRLIFSCPAIKEQLKEKSLLLKGDFNLPLYKILRSEFIEKPTPDLKLSFLTSYFATVHDVVSKSKKAYDLACIIADLFSEYVLSDAPMTADWKAGRNHFLPGDNDTQAVHEIWQKALWQQLFSRDTPYISLLDILDLLDQPPEPDAVMPSSIVIFGSYFLNPVTYQFFLKFSQHVKVHFLIMSPISQQNLNAKNGDLLSRWGQFAFSHEAYLRQHFNLENFLGQPSPASAGAQFQHQFDLHALTGPQREIEVLKDILLNLLDRASTLQLTDIAVMAPDIDVYVPFIEAIFDAGESVMKLPYNIIDIQQAREGHYCSGFLALLELVGARFNRKEIFTLLNNPCFLQRMNVPEGTAQAWLELCQTLEIKWGLDDRHKEQLGLGNISANTWQDGILRALLGLALNNEKQASVYAQNSCETIPFNVLFDLDAESLGKLSAVVHSLYNDLFRLDQITLPLEEWVTLAKAIEETYLSVRPGSSDDQEDRLQLQDALQSIQAAIRNVQEINRFELDFATFKAVLLNAFNESSGAVGHYLSGGITFSSIKPLRAIPFRIIVLLGMDESVYPRRENVYGFDLTTGLPDRIEDSARHIDNYAFLEILTSARERLIVLYTGKNNLTGDVMQPSILVREWQDYLAKTGQPCTPVRHHLQNFHPEYFSQHASIFSYNKVNYKAALAYENKNIYQSKPVIHDSVQNIDYPHTITLNDLRTFLSNPVKSFYNKTLGIYLRETLNPLEDIDESLELSRLNEVIYCRELVESSVPLAPDTFIHRLILEGRHSRGFFSIYDLEELSRAYAGITTGLARLTRELKLKGQKVKYVLSEAVRHRDQFSLPALKVQDRIITGTINPHFVEGVLVSYLSGTLNLRAQVNDFLAAVVLLSHPDLSDFDRVQTVLINDRGELFSQSITRSQAQSILTAIVAAYLLNLNGPVPAYPEACEISLKARGGDREAAVRSWYDKQLAATQDYSRIRDCLYRQSAYEALPDFSGVHRLADDIYAPLTAVGTEDV